MVRGSPHATNAFPCPIQGKRKVHGEFDEGRYLPSRPPRPSYHDPDVDLHSPHALYHLSARSSLEIEQAHEASTPRRPLDSVETVAQRVAPLGQPWPCLASPASLTSCPPLESRGLVGCSTYRRPQTADRRRYIISSSWAEAEPPLPSRATHAQRYAAASPSCPVSTVGAWAALALQRPPTQ